VFGNSLASVPKVSVDQFGLVPKVLVNLVSILDNHLEVEGLFRKTGSMARMKELKNRVDNGETLDDECSPLDVAGLMKQFFRDMPDPLLTFELYDSFMECFVNLGNDNAECSDVTCKLCFFLPEVNLATVRYLMSFLSRLASKSAENKMDAYNIAVCVAPNILFSLQSKKELKKPASLSGGLMTPS
ncbi:hypothetical protein HELRODRAFT_134629, partial [Helobdella robusta]|uniref:Rho-GAP domain-containing protein n=1 Tax=Helobdella robusta TaxID=6412 RepID=T1EI56_HELRO